MDKYRKKAINDDLSKYCILSQKYDYIEVSEWHNGEGFDIDMNGTLIRLTHGQIDAMTHLIKELQYNFKEKD